LRQDNSGAAQTLAEINTRIEEDPATVIVFEVGAGVGERSIRGPWMTKARDLSSQKP
jgi:hypothetical protein